MRMGHRLVVLAPIEEGKPQTAPDEPYVLRCYTVDRNRVKGFKPLFLDPAPFMELSYDVVVVQNLEIMPMKELLHIWPEVRSRAATVLVLHEGYVPPYEEFYTFEWDAIVCFDERYVRLFADKLPVDRMRIIPFPCHPWRPGDKEASRVKLGLPLEKKIVFSYGISLHTYTPILDALDELSREFDMVYLLVPSEGGLPLELLGRYRFIWVRRQVLTVDELYEYLYAADALLLYKHSPDVVVASTVYLCLGSGCPIVINESRYTETLDGEVLKYRGPEELKEVLARVFEGERPSEEAIRRFIERHEASKVASMFIELFEELIGSKRASS